MEIVERIKDLQVQKDGHAGADDEIAAPHRSVIRIATPVMHLAMCAAEVAPLLTARKEPLQASFSLGFKLMPRQPSCLRSTINCQSFPHSLAKLLGENIVFIPLSLNRNHRNNLLFCSVLVSYQACH